MIRRLLFTLVLTPAACAEPPAQILTDTAVEEDIADVAEPDADGHTDTASDADGVAYRPGGAPLGQSGYWLEITTPEGETITFDRDLTQTPSAFSFGSTHLAAPALTLAINDTLVTPAFAIIEMNFGFLVGNDENPITTPGPGTYTFSMGLPYLEIEFPPTVWTSRAAAVRGAIEITDYARRPGGLFAGTMAGTLIDAADSRRAATVRGSFSFVLPPTSDGQ